jgi:hypothetical protein
VFALPAAVVGLNIAFASGATQELRIDPNGTETIALPSTGVQGAAGKYLVADAERGDGLHRVHEDRPVERVRIHRDVDR